MSGTSWLATTVGGIPSGSPRKPSAGQNPLGAISGPDSSQNRSQGRSGASGGQLPSFATPRTPRRPSLGWQLGKVAQVLGFQFYPWQQLVADVGLELAPDDTYQFRTVGAQVSRQNGKTALIWARIVLEALKPKHYIAYTAQDRMAARDKLEELYLFLRDSPVASGVTRFIGTNGRERIEFRNGSVARITTPSKKGGRGLSLDLVVIDEALTIDPEVISSLLPTMATRKNAQLWLVSNAGIPVVSAMLARYRQLGHESISNPEATLAWFEWCPDLDSQGQLIGDPFQPEQWYRANPSLGLEGGVTIEALRDAARGLELHQFKREHLNLWAELEGAPLLDPEAWAHLLRTDVTVGAQMALSVDITPERSRATIAAASKEGGLVPVEIVESQVGVGWVLERLVELHKRWDAPVVIDGGSPAGSLIPSLEQAKVDVKAIGARDYARACGIFHDLVADHRLCHRGDWRLNDSIKGATKRPLGEQWAWDRRSGVDISPLVAVTLAAFWVEAHELLTPRIF